MILGTTREFKNRNPNFFKHEYSDKLVIMDKVERTLHKKIDAKMFLGDNGSGKNAYMTAIQPIAAVKKAQNETLRQMREQKRKGQYVPPNVRLAEQKELEAEQRQEMINKYRDRLYPKFKV